LWQLAPGAGTFREELVFHGAESVLRLRFPAPYLGSAPAELRHEGGPERRWVDPANAYVRQLVHFHDCVTAGAACRVPAADGARTVELLTELYRAAVAV
jgi:predicted dehydrogenase